MECASLWNASHNGPSAIGTPDWLQRLERGENNPDEVVAVGAAIQGGVLRGDVKDVGCDLRPDEDVETEFVAFDRPRVVRVLEQSRPTWIPSAWCRMTRTRTKHRTTMILEHVIATSWPSRHPSRRS
jgi:hypothetical protein